ncbi:two-component sensor histidine kinase [Bacillus methanolicus]|uniref:sensor histidine kinase n=1 Tax=Bacillus methanolicus TaxID=1471 RepID=UPI0023804DE1|nr:ATP-binding protein [Bacillus methanolicus]MDE3839247.1 two-component sensor histidine kinase [Bacillus methanolicus]
MKFFNGSLVKKLWFTITAAILITILYSYFLSYFFYERLYVDNVEKSLVEEGKRLALDYKGGPLTEQFIEKIEWYSTKTNYEVLVVNNPRELSACLPFEIDYQTLIGEEEREQLLKGKPVKKSGYEERFDRKILAVIIPLMDQNRLEGIIYLYVPLAKISELTKDFVFVWIIAGSVFALVAVLLGTKWIGRLTRPLIEMKEAANRVSQGDYSARIHLQSNDEVGQLANAFNHMSASIQKEDERKKEFIANVSHELRTPISYVKGYSEAIVSGIVKNEEEMNKYLQLIHREAGRMERLVYDLLDLSKLDAEEYKLNKIPIPLAQVIEDATQKYLPILKEKGIQLHSNFDPDIIINGEAERMEQIVQNLIDNSICYTEKGGTISIILSDDPEGCKLEIADTGTGIPPEDLQKVTQRFYRVNKGRSRNDGGTGLGLAIVEKLVHLHSGKLTITSEIGKGTTVTIVLPSLEI